MNTSAISCRGVPRKVITGVIPIPVTIPRAHMMSNSKRLFRMNDTTEGRFIQALLLFNVKAFQSDTPIPNYRMFIEKLSITNNMAYESGYRVWFLISPENDPSNMYNALMKLNRETIAEQKLETEFDFAPEYRHFQITDSTSYGHAVSISENTPVPSNSLDAYYTTLNVARSRSAAAESTVNPAATAPTADGAHREFFNNGDDFGDDPSGMVDGVPVLKPQPDVVAAAKKAAATKEKTAADLNAMQSRMEIIMDRNPLNHVHLFNMNDPETLRRVQLDICPQQKDVAEYAIFRHASGVECDFRFPFPDHVREIPPEFLTHEKFIHLLNPHLLPMQHTQSQIDINMFNEMVSCNATGINDVKKIKKRQRLHDSDGEEADGDERSEEDDARELETDFAKSMERLKARAELRRINSVNPNGLSLDEAMNVINSGKSFMYQRLSTTNLLTKDSIDTIYKKSDDEEVRNQYVNARSAFVFQAIREFETNMMNDSTDGKRPIDMRVYEYYTTLRYKERSDRQRQESPFLIGSPRIDKNKSEFANMVISMAIAEGAIFRIHSEHRVFSLMQWSTYARFRCVNDLNINILLIGDAEAAKSFFLNLIEKISLPQTAYALTTETMHSGTTGEDKDGHVHINHELNMNKFMGTDGESTGSSILKDRLTKCSTNRSAFVIGEKNGGSKKGRDNKERSKYLPREGGNQSGKTKDFTQNTYTSMIENYFVATNEIDAVRKLKAVLSRFFVIHMGNKLSSERVVGTNNPRDTVTINRTDNMFKDPQFVTECERRHLREFIVYLVNMFLAVDIFEPINMSVYDSMSKTFFMKMEALGIDGGFIREKQRIKLLAQQICIVEAVQKSMFGNAAPIRLMMMNDTGKHENAKYGEFRLEYLAMIEPYLYVSKEAAAYALTLASISYSDTLSERLTRYMVSVASNGFDKFSKQQMVFDLDNLDPVDRLFWSREPCVDLSTHMEGYAEKHGDRGMFADDQNTRAAWQTHGHCISPMYRVIDRPIDDIVKAAAMYMPEPRPSEENIYQCILKMLTREIDTHYYKRNGKIAQIEKKVYDSKLGRYVTKTINATKKMRVMKLAITNTVPGVRIDSEEETRVYNQTRRNNRSDVVDILHPGETYFETLRDEKEYKMSNLQDVRFKEHKRSYYGKRNDSNDDDNNNNGGIKALDRSYTGETRLRLMVLTSFLQQPTDKILHCMKGWGYNGMEPVSIVCGDHEPMYPGILRVRTLDSYDDEYGETCMPNSDFITDVQAAFMSYDGTKKGMLDRLGNGRAKVTQTLNFSNIEQTTFIARIMSMYGDIDYGLLPETMRLANVEDYEIHYYMTQYKHPELFGDVQHVDYPNDYFRQIRQADHIAKAHMRGEISIENSALHVADCLDPKMIKIFAGKEDSFMEMENVVREKTDKGSLKLLNVKSLESAKRRVDFIKNLAKTENIKKMHEQRSGLSCQELIAADYINKGVAKEVAMIQAIQHIRDQESKFPGSMTIKHRYFAMVNSSLVDEIADGTVQTYTRPIAVEIDSIDEDIPGEDVVERISIPYIDSNMQPVYNHNAKKIVADEDDNNGPDGLFLGIDSEELLFSNDTGSQKNNSSSSFNTLSIGEEKSCGKSGYGALFSDEEDESPACDNKEDEDEQSAAAYYHAISKENKPKKQDYFPEEDNSRDSSVPGEFYAPYAVGTGYTSSDSEAVQRKLADRPEANKTVDITGDINNSKRHPGSSSQRSFRGKNK